MAKDTVRLGRDQLPLIAVATLVVGLLVIYLYTGEPRSIESSPPGVIQLEIDDPAALEQNGQPLTNDGSEQGSQSVQSTSPTDQSTGGSNLQGSPSTQSTAPLEGSGDIKVESE